jgi:hypothetical protein
MASQISHIVYAKRYFDSLELVGNGKFDGKINKDEFILGCTFPDIRRIDKRIKRKDTHLKFPKLDLDFSGLTSFEAGWKFHLYCDMRREEILNKYNFYVISGATDFFGNIAKRLEDELAYDEYNNWEKVVNYFNNPPFLEDNLLVDKETYNLWYAILAKYMEKKPDDKANRTFISKLSNFSNKVDDIILCVNKLRENKKAVEILKKVKDEII